MKMNSLYLILSIISILTYIAKDLASSRLALTNNLVNEPITETQQPTIYTFVDRENRFFYENLLKLWSTRWELSGWTCKVLTPSDSMKYPGYDRIIKVFDEMNLDTTERNSYLGYMAMSTLPRGGIHIFANYYVLPLHDKSQVTLPLPESSNEDDLIFTSYDIFNDSFLFGNLNGWTKATNVLLKNIRDTRLSRIQKLELKIPEMNTVSFVIKAETDNEDIRHTFDRSNHVGMGYGYAFTACKLAKDHYAIQLPPTWWTDNSSTSSFSWKFMEYYDNQCFLNREGISERLATLAEKYQKRKPLDHTYSILHRTDIINENTRSEVDCGKRSCKITNACITSSSGIALFGSIDHVEQEKTKLLGYKKQAFACRDCDNNIHAITSRGEGSFRLKDGVATMGLGLRNYPCDAHMHYVIWPLIRVNLLQRNEQDVINNGVGDLYLQVADSFSCIPMYSPMSEKLTLYRFIPENSMKCYREIIVGTSLSTTFLSTNFKEDMRAMRSLYYNYYNIDETVTKDTIVITKSDNLYDLDEIFNMIQKEYPTYQTEVMQWENYSLKEQLKILARTKVLIGLPVNKLKYIITFMHEETGIIDYCSNGAENPSKSSLFFSSIIHSREYYKESCSGSGPSFIDTKLVVDVTMLKQSITALRLL